MRRARRLPRLRPMPGRGRHGDYATCRISEAVGAIAALAWGLLLSPLEVDPPWADTMR